MEECLRAFWHACLYALVIATVTITGIVDNATTEDGLHHYAEKPWTFLYPFFPSLTYIPMPLNTIVNFLYVAIGFFWILKLSNFAQDKPNLLKKEDLYMQYLFYWMSILYGNVQLVRIMTQHHRAAILDQWYTLPIFAWAGCLCYHVMYGWHMRFYLKIIRISTLMYGLALVHPLGFDVALALHIFLVLYIVIKVMFSLERIPSGTRSAFWKTFLACVGFILLKVLDHYLPVMHDVFFYVSGHFLSKICDSLQIHFGAQFFFHIFEDRMLVSKMK